MFRETPTSQEAYHAGYRDGFTVQQSCPERFPGYEAEYRKGHRKGWQDGYMNQPAARC